MSSLVKVMMGQDGQQTNTSCVAVLRRVINGELLLSIYVICC